MAYTDHNANVESVYFYDGVYIDQIDIASLDSGQQLYNAIIEFYVKYLSHEWLSVEQRHRLQFLDYATLDACMRRRPNEPLQIELDLLEKDFIMAPVNLHNHWFLVVLCYPRNVLIDDCADEYRPKLLIFDSAIHYAARSRPNFVKRLRSFVQSELARSLGESSTTIGNLTKRLPMNIVPTRQQDNEYDCGLFLMGNVETFFIDMFQLAVDERRKTLRDNGESGAEADDDQSVEQRRKVKELIESVAFHNNTHILATFSPENHQRKRASILASYAEYQ